MTSQCWIAVLFASAMALTAQQPLVQENSTKVTDHVYEIKGFPNIFIVVGQRATLVVDTGLGTRNGATAARVAQKLSMGPTVYLTTTHYHPEHAAGEPGFPANTILVRPAAQQKDMDEHGVEMIGVFSRMSAQNAELLSGVKLRTPDIIFDREVKLDLGGVTARLLWFGAAHTKGDEVIMVDPDSALITGDVVQNHVVPAIPANGGSPKSWLAVLDKLEPLKPRYILPDHSEVGDGSLIATEKALIGDLQTRALALKSQGVSAEDAGKQLLAEFKTRYPGWPNLNPIPNFVRQIYTQD